MNDLFSRMIPRAPALLALLALASCGADKIVPPCPPVRIDNATAVLTKFKDGAAQDMANMEYRAELVGYKGQCTFKDDRVELSMDIDFAFEPGPAAGGATKVPYFVAIPQFYPRAEGKRVLEFAAPSGKGAQRVREANITTVIPLKKDEPAASYDVYIGLQLTQQQLDYNRAHPAR
ncbi:MAG: hypothetical protein K1X51_07755 [Rhodospirillaceae bacterium]|nr:hypothetical protein [Rhodospirillaceae bacterium]